MNTTTSTTVATLKSALAQVEPAIAKRKNVAALTCVRIGESRIQATNFDALIDAPAYGADFPPMLVPATDLKRVLSALKGPDTITLEASSDGLVVESRRGRTTLPVGADVEDWPTWAETLEDSPTFSCKDPIAAASILRDVAAFESTDETRPVLTSTYMRGGSSCLNLTACDSYCLASDAIEGWGDPVAGLIASSRYIKKMARVDRIVSTLGAAEDRAFDVHRVELHDDAAGVRVVIRGIAGKYMDVDQLVPTSWEHRATMPDGVADAVEYIRKVVKSDRAPVRLAFGIDDLEVSATVQDGPLHTASFDLDDADMQEPVTIGANAVRLARGLMFLGDRPRIELVSPLRPMLFTSAERSARIYLLMPTRLSG